MFDIGAPTIEDFHDGVCVGITLESATWDQYNISYSMMEDSSTRIC